MNKNVYLLLKSIGIMVTLVASTSQGAITLFEKDHMRFYLHGFAELDAIHDSTQNLTDITGNNPMALDQSSTLNSNGRFSQSIRNSRLGFGLVTHRPDHVAGKGYIEMDFEGYDPAPYKDASTGNPAQSEGSYYNNSTMRVRHAYLQMEAEWFSILCGQTWSLLGWQAEYVMSTITVAPIAGELFERTPQITATFGSKDGFEGAISIERPSQRDAEQPNLNAGFRVHMFDRKAAYVSTSGDVKASTMSISATGSYRSISESHVGGSTVTHKKARVFAVDAMIPILAISGHEAVGNTLALTGEWSKGQGYGEEFPGWTGGISNQYPAKSQILASGQQTLIDSGIAGYQFNGDGTYALTLINLQSANGSLQYHFPESMKSWMTVGYGTLWSDNANTLVGTNIYDRTADTFVNFIHDFDNPEMRVGLEYSRYDVRFAGDASHTINNRVQMSTWYRF